jgi:receptor protein-tyrosine kinase
MADNSQPLNLIQRALNRKGGGRDDDHRWSNEPAPALDHGPQSGVAPPRSAAPAAPADERQGRALGLNFGELRRRGMILPDVKVSAIANEYRSIKRRVLAHARDANTRALVNNLVMVTSSLPQEGKTFTAVNLALSLAAERDLRVLLMDCDLIRPGVRSLFAPTDGRGLVEYLRGSVQSIGDVTYRCEEIPNLSVIFSGKSDDESAELISSARMFELLVEISQRYPDRIIVIDTPPVLAAVEPATLAAHVHQLIMVVAALQSDRAQVQKSLETVAACRNINLLFNKAPRWRQMAADTYYYYATADSGRV